MPVIFLFRISDQNILLLQTGPISAFVAALGETLFLKTLKQ